MLQKQFSEMAEHSTLKSGYSTSILYIAVWYSHLNTAANVDNIISHMQ